MDFKQMDMVVVKALNLDRDFWKPNPRSGLRDGDVEKSVSAAVIEPYGYYIWVYSCVRAIKDALGGLPRRIRDTRNGQMIDRSREPFSRIITNANPHTTGSQFIDEVLIRLLLDGQVFIAGGNRESFGSGMIPSELYIIPDKNISSRRDKRSKQIVGWTYSPDGSVKIPYENNELIRVRFINPYRDDAGMPPLRAALLAMNTDVRAASYNANFFRNQAQLSGTLETDQPLTQEQARPIAEQFKQQYAGPDKSGSVALLHSGLKYNVTASSHRDMQYGDQRNWNKNEVLAAFGVPKNVLADYADQNYSNSVVAFKSFWEHTLLPIDRLVNMIFTYSWVNWYNDAWEMVSDYSDVEVLQSVANEKIDAWEVLVQNGVHREEAARMLNIPIDWDRNRELESRDLDETQNESSDVQQDQDEERQIDGIWRDILRRYNAITTDLRNRCMDELDAGRTPMCDLNVCFEKNREQLSSIYLNAIQTFIDHGSVSTTSVPSTSEMIELLNQRAQLFKSKLSVVLDDVSAMDNKRDIHERFQQQYGDNKRLSQDEVTSLLEALS